MNKGLTAAARRAPRLALLLIRVAEITTGATWNTITNELDLLTLGTFRQTAELTNTQRDLLAKLKIAPRRR